MAERIAEEFSIGDKIYVPYFTLALKCPHRGDLIRLYECLQETAAVASGYVSSGWGIPGEVGGDILMDINLMGGSSGSPIFLFREEFSERKAPFHRDFRVIGVQNAGWGSGNSVAQVFTQQDAEIIIAKVKEFLDKRTFWDEP